MASYKVNIPKPCAEQWEQMKPTGCGAFCHSCKKEVIDFTEKTAVEISQLIGRNTGPICGKFKSKQLAQVYEYMPDKTPKSYWFNKGLIGAGLSILVATTQVKSTNNPSTQLTENTFNINELNSLPTVNDEPIDTNKVTITGIVIDKNKEPLPGTVIYLQNDSNKIGTITDMDGKFSLQIPANYFENNTAITIVVRQIGFIIRTITIERNRAQEFNTIELEANTDLDIVGLLIVRPTPLTKKPETPIEHELWYDYKFNGGE